MKLFYERLDDYIVDQALRLKTMTLAELYQEVKGKGSCLGLKDAVELKLWLLHCLQHEFEYREYDQIRTERAAKMLELASL